MRTRNVVIYLMLAVAIAGCGGGGGGGANFTGGYLFTTRLISDGCELNLGQTRDIIYKVEQTGDRIVATNLSTGNMLTGSTIGNGWFASTSTNQGSCVASAQVAYDGSNGGAVGVIVSCAGTGECTTEYTAVVTRD